jgi:peptidoglycan-associated lipoprotein
MKFNSFSTLVLAALLAVGATGCKKQMDRTNPLLGYGNATIRDGNAGNPLGDGMKPGGTDGQGTGTTTPGPGGVVPQTGKRSPDGRPQDREKYRSETVYFDFDKHTVKAAEAKKVQDAANKFKAEDPATDLLIEGHCDERGTEGYNQALGEKRALAVRELLVSLGVPADRIHTVSFGKDKPAVVGHDEAAYKKNRRGEFILVLPK